MTLSLENKIKRIASELGVDILENDSLDADGHYIAKYNLIVIKSSLSEKEKLKIILHELGHASKHHDNHYLYNLTFSLHSKMEYEATCFMIEHLLDSYLAKADLEPQDINYMKFIEDNNLNTKFELLIKELLKEKNFAHPAM